MQTSLLARLSSLPNAKFNVKRIIFNDKLNTAGLWLAKSLEVLHWAAAAALFAAGALFIFSLMAMVFRNVYLIFKTAKRKTWFSKGDTPFQKDITRMVREIGIFYISIPVVGLVMSVISRLALGAEFAEVNTSIEGVVTGILLLCLSQVFAYGAQLEGDVDGLL